MGRILVLPSTVTDQIAAGEVVERPASVVKELVENALDAGATTITVELEDGGKELIRVSDDGIGMDREDALLAVERHATSKIRSTTDLIGVPTYGFRGEALSSVASVSRFEMETAPEGGTPEGSGEGTRVRVRAGRLEGSETISRTGGTTVTVRRLFANVPARRKFLRAARSETRAVTEAIGLLALAKLDVAFTVMSDGRTLLDAPRVANPGQRIADLFGRALAAQLVPVEFHEGYITVRGFVQRPAEARAAGRRACLFVNGRPFRDPFLVRAAEGGFRATIAPGMRPSMILSILVPGDRVDVNAHPTKLEVRFRDKMLVERAVEEAVRASLGSLTAAATVQGPGDSSAGDWQGDGGSTSGGAAPDRAGDGAMALTGSLFQSEAGGSLDVANGTRAILQVFDTFIVFETPAGLTIVDQHSAHERILYEQAMAHLEGRGAAGQRLLLPLTLDLAREELDAVEQHGALLSAVGFEVEPFGGASVVVHAVPNPHPRFDARRCFEELVADLARDRSSGLPNRMERFAANYGCRAAVKAGHRLEPVEMRDLLRRLFACKLPPHDVHGRPTIVQLPKSELERRFGRA
ncbi:MAG: DNA mismatch repair endonuclease MutL [Gemmatimonadota bacterium]|nr:DNA mismatch repair endonuclease MutL [Gemmatimonadota bacterium]MDH3477197.1 DNA mismatch repair endonuclease MutL [Gemmatimonadota bacterium]MDH3569649.1 DNA mismatch repair endonuclease MutL [Gemmatimonadota bacterium]MDH5550185.1 DNA mismatch repair endonuclease MutL [Gemmatimonadota bacterium]